MNNQLSFFSDETCLEDKYILMSLQEQYYTQIINGTKKYEYRKVFKEYPLSAFIYITKPKMVIKGYVKFGMPIIGTPEKISEIAEAQRLGHGKIILDYLNGLKKCYAVPILEVHEFNDELSIKQIKSAIPSFHPPQSYLTMENHPRLLDYLLKFETIKICINSDESRNI